MYFCSIELTIGFESTVYALMEPDSGTTTREEMVCIVTSGSRLQESLTVQPLWTDITTTCMEFPFLTVLDSLPLFFL